MPLPKGWDALENSPGAVSCGRCRNVFCKATRHYRLLSTGIVEQLYICQGCLWGSVVRYAADQPDRHIVCQLITPGKGWGWVRPIPKTARKF